LSNFENCAILDYYVASSGCPETSVTITTTRCIITQKSTVLSYFAAEAKNLAFPTLVFRKLVTKITMSS